jgi:transcriptional regulator with XRE-family HTH domain
MSSERAPLEAWGQHLAKALRAIRKARGLSAAQVAGRMGMDRRNYGNFEAGRGRLNVERILLFAQATDSDGWAIMASALVGARGLALGAADNKLLLAFFLLLGEFDERVGASMRLLDTAEVVTAFNAAFSALEAAIAERQSRFPEGWLREGAARIALRGVGTDSDGGSS